MKLFAPLVLVFWLLTSMMVSPAPAEILSTNNNLPEDSALKVNFMDSTPTVVNSDNPDRISYKLALTNNSEQTIQDLTTSVNRKDPFAKVADYTHNQLLAPEQFNSFQTKVKSKNLVLPPKSTKEITITLAITNKANAPDGTLNITKPGVYPLLFNIQGKDQSGNNIYLGKRILLPIINLPGTHRPVIPQPSKATPTTLIWPIVGEKNLISAPTGMGVSPNIIHSEYEKIFSPTGWLGGMVSTLEKYFEEKTNSSFKKSICFAIDPSLLITAKYMSSKYTTLLDPLAPTGQTKEFSKSNQVAKWLISLKKIVKNTCVIPLPLGTPELNILAKFDNELLNKRALIDSKTVVDDILGINSNSKVLISPSGFINGPSLKLAAKYAIPNLLVSNNTMDQKSKYLTNQTLATDEHTKLIFYNGGLTEAMNNIGNEKYGTDNYASLMDSISLLQIKNSAPQIIYPGSEWRPNSFATSKLITTFENLFNSNAITPNNLDNEIATNKVNFSKVANLKFSTDELATLSTLEFTKNTRFLQELNQLYSAMFSVPHTSFTRDSFISPLLDNILRGLSILFNGPDTTFNFMSEYFIKQIKKSVYLISPGEKYTLASEKSPIPLAINNKLPVRIKVKVISHPPAGVTVENYHSLLVPSKGVLQINLATHSNVKKYLNIDFQLQTISGLDMGTPVTITVRSNAYGKILFQMSLVLLVIVFLLSMYRLFRRWRNKNTAANIIRVNVKDVANPNKRKPSK